MSIWGVLRRHGREMAGRLVLGLGRGSVLLALALAITACLFAAFQGVAGTLAARLALCAGVVAGFGLLCTAPVALLRRVGALGCGLVLALGPALFSAKFSADVLMAALCMVIFLGVFMSQPFGVRALYHRSPLAAGALAGLYSALINAIAVPHAAVFLAKTSL